MLEILKQEVGVGQFCQHVHRVHLRVVSCVLSSMLEILKQEVGVGQFCQRVHWVHRQVVSHALSSTLKILKQGWVRVSFVSVYIGCIGK
jgi:hypothetical protein